MMGTGLNQPSMSSRHCAIAFIATAIFLALFCAPAFSLGSVPGLDWDNYSADRDALLANPALTEGQKDLLETDLESIEYFNGEIESAEYDFTLLSDEKSEFTAQDVAEIAASNEQGKAANAQMRETLSGIRFLDTPSGKGYAKVLANAQAARANYERALVSESTALSRTRQGIYATLLARLGRAEQGLLAGRQSVAASAPNNALSLQLTEKWINAGLAESASLKGSIVLTLEAEKLAAEEIALEIEGSGLSADALSTAKALEIMLTPSAQSGDGRTGFVELPDAGGPLKSSAELAAEIQGDIAKLKANAANCSSSGKACRTTRFINPNSSSTRPLESRGSRKKE